ncbi:aldolase/citrate lyase family protein, partial [Streptomyces sp. TRM76130]|nr:aldolase/citrate lyase family protein [Streptomyces sp. TRM76130]
MTAATAELLTARQPVPVRVRVNALDGPWAAADLAALAGLPGLSGLRLTQSDRARTGRPGGKGDRRAPLYALLESALGVERAYAVAAAHRAVRGGALGEADLRADLGLRDGAGLDLCRSRVVVAALAAGLAPPCQSVHPDIRDLVGLAASSTHGRALGFLGGRAAVHPRQLPVIERAYLPGAAELDAAEAVLRAGAVERGAQALADGRFVD